MLVATVSACYNQTMEVLATLSANRNLSAIISIALYVQADAMQNCPGNLIKAISAMLYQSTIVELSISILIEWLDCKRNVPCG